MEVNDLVIPISIYTFCNAHIVLLIPFTANLAVTKLPGSIHTTQRNRGCITEV